jgi:pimeloyl-ACP methyl ester carboxylesterase
MAQPTPSADDRFLALPTRPRSRLQATSALAGLVTAKKRSTSMNALQPTTTPIPYRSSEGGRYPVLFIHGFMDAGAVWEPTISRLHADLQKITIDLPGMGQLRSYAGEVSLKTGKTILIVAA